MLNSMSKIRRQSRKRQKALALPWRFCGFFALAVLPVLHSPAAEDTDSNSGEITSSQQPAPETPRDYYNTGTELLLKGKLREAESDLLQAVASQLSGIQRPALYNLGQVRAGLGAEALKNAPNAMRTAARGESAARFAQDASRQADDALANDDVQKMVAAYVRGHGAHRELRAAMKAIRNAMETHGEALARWRRAAGDFRSAVELNGSDPDAQFNADEMDRAIARLVDKMNRLQQAMAMMSQIGAKIEEQLQKLKGRIPADMMPPGAPGDDDDDLPFGLMKGQKEGPSRDGEQIKLSPEEAGQILDGFKLGGDRPLPMGADKAGNPRDRSGRNW